MALIDFNQSSAVELYRSYRKFRRIQYLFLLPIGNFVGRKVAVPLPDTSKTKIGRSGISIILNVAHTNRPLIFLCSRREKEEPVPCAPAQEHLWLEWTN